MLTAKQARFVDEYLKDLNATKAAARAGYSELTASRQGPRLLSNPEVSTAIDARKISRSERIKADSDWVLKRLVEEAEADLKDIFDSETNDLLPVEKWPLIWRIGLVAGVEVEALFQGEGKNRVQIGYVKKVRLSDRIKRIELIGKHVKVNAFQDTVEVKGLDALAERLARAKAAA